MYRAAAVTLLGLWLAAAQAQGIYTCVDSQGRKRTADRPIVECADREQKVLGPSGTVKTTIVPALTAKERADQEARQKQEEEERARQAEERRRERALLTRYPSKTVHDKERAEALAQIGVVRQAALNRVTELQRQRAALAAEMEFYKKDPGKAPSSLRRQVEETSRSLAVQARFIADQDAEIVRLNARFDEELARLQSLWALLSPGASSANGKSR